MGSPNRQTGRAMARYIEETVRLIGEGGLSGMVTCPIAKSALKAAGYSYPGHTEMLADLTRCDDFAMMLAGDRLRVTLVTIHCALAQVVEPAVGVGGGAVDCYHRPGVAG